MPGRGREIGVLVLDEEERRLGVVELVRSSAGARRHESGRQDQAELRAGEQHRERVRASCR